MIDKKEIPKDCTSKQELILIFDKNLSQEDFIKEAGCICSTCLKRYSCTKRISQNIA